MGQAIQWFPGHMAKTKRKLKESLKLVDAVAEIIDARIPISSRNPDLASIISGKPHIILINKSDMADDIQTDRWCKYYASLGIEALKVDCRSGKGLKLFSSCVESVLKEKIQRWNSKGIKGRKIRVMVVGIPNVGKSSFINRLSKNSKAKVEDRPGVTRSNQWFPVNDRVEILDTPGVLWPKFDDDLVGKKLAFTGAVKDDILDIEDLAMEFIEMLKDRIMDKIESRFKLDKGLSENMSAYDIISAIGRKRGLILPGNEVDIRRTSVMLIDEFRAGKIGKITLETVKNIG